MQALILIDIQNGFDDPIWGLRNNPNAEEQAAKLLDFARQHSWMIVHIRHISKEKASPLSGQGACIKDIVAPLSGEYVLEKSVNSAFIGTNLEHILHENNVQTVTICGFTTPHCVSTTTRMAANLGFTVTLAHDACAAFSSNADSSWSNASAMSPQEIHANALHHLHNEFASVRSVRDIIQCD